MQTGQRGAHRPAPGNYSGNVFYRQQREQAARQKAAEAAQRIEEQQSAYLTPAERVHEMQARLPRGIAVWDPEINDVVVDYTGGR
jgi:hypothetical protein